MINSFKKDTEPIGSCGINEVEISDEQVELVILCLPKEMLLLFSV